jgi:hypothetical protein
MPKRRRDVYCVTRPEVFDQGVRRNNVWYTLTVAMLAISIACMMVGRAAWAVTLSTITMLTIVSAIASAPVTHMSTQSGAPSMSTQSGAPSMSTQSGAPSMSTPERVIQRRPPRGKRRKQEEEAWGYTDDPDDVEEAPNAEDTLAKPKLKRRVAGSGAGGDPQPTDSRRVRFQTESSTEPLPADSAHPLDPDAQAARENAQAIRLIREEGLYGVKSNYNQDILERSAGVADAGLLAQPVGQREGFASFLLHDMPSKRDQFMRQRTAAPVPAGSMGSSSSAMLNAPSFVGGRWEA